MTFRCILPAAAMQAWDGGRGRGEAVTATPRADLLAGLRQCAPCTGWDLWRSGHPDRCGRSCAVLVSAPSNMVLPPAGSIIACRGQLTISLTGSSGTVSSISTSRSVSFSTNENQSFSLWRKSGSCTVYLVSLLLQWQGFCGTLLHSAR